MIMFTTLVTLLGMLLRWPTWPVPVLVIDTSGEKGYDTLNVNARNWRHARERTHRRIRHTLPDGWVAAIHGGWVVDRRDHS